MVVVDQFEELFAFRRAGVNRDTVASRDEAAAFVGMLIRSASEPAGRVWAILTMRSDFIGDCEAFLGLPEQISHSQFLVPAARSRADGGGDCAARFRRGRGVQDLHLRGGAGEPHHQRRRRPPRPAAAHAARAHAHVETRRRARRRGRPRHGDARRLRGRRRNRNGPLAPRRRRLGRNQGRSEKGSTSRGVSFCCSATSRPTGRSPAADPK